VHADDRGVELPERFTDPRREYAALTAGCAAVDLGFRTLVRASGPDRASFLQGMLTCDVATLAPGRLAQGLLLTIQGRVTADVRVLATADVLLLDVDVRARVAMLEALEKLLVADDVELGDPSPAHTAIGVEGPAAAAVLAALGLEAVPPGEHAETRVAGVVARALDASEVRGPGRVLHVAADGAAAVWDALVAAGAEPCGMQAVEARRIEVGVPRIGVDMDGSTLAIELPVEDLISATKGCYLGQEVVARGTARGQVQRRLVGVRFDGGVPARGASLRHAGKDVGRVTSVARARAADEPIGLALVRREHWAPGSELEIDAGRACVAPFPLA
jgi:folate-binding protein YgfZ